MDDGLWMRNCNGDGDGDGDGFNGYRRMEPKRSHEWVDDGGCDLDFYPYKRQAVEPPSFVMPGYGYPNPGHGLIGSRNMENMHSSESSQPEGPVLPEVELIHQISSMAGEIDTLKANMAAMQVGSQSRVSTEFLNPDEHLCSIKQMGTVQEYRKEFGRRSGRVKHWPEHCLLGVFLNGLKEELKIDVRIRKPVSIDMATSLAMECEANNKQHLTSRSSLSAMSATSNARVPNTIDNRFAETKVVALGVDTDSQRDTVARTRIVRRSNDGARNKKGGRMLLCRRIQEDC